MKLRPKERQQERTELLFPSWMNWVYSFYASTVLLRAGWVQPAWFQSFPTLISLRTVISRIACSAFGIGEHAMKTYLAVSTEPVNRDPIHAYATPRPSDKLFWFGLPHVVLLTNVPWPLEMGHKSLHWDRIRWLTDIILNVTKLN